MKPYSRRYGETITNDMLRLLLGKRLGKGQARDVYECAFNKELVVKIEARIGKEAAPFSNVIEHAIWHESEGTEWRRWLAPCDWISPFGTALIMSKTTPMTEAERPRDVPSFLSDLQPSNWGMLDGRPVAHDYGNNAVYHLALKHAVIERGAWHDGRGAKLDVINFEI